MATKTATAGASEVAPDVVRISTRTVEELTRLAASAVGAQIILDYNGTGSLGARGGAGGTIEENTLARDVHLVALGLDPNAPSGPPMVPAPEAATMAAEDAAGLVRGRATKISSLAAGLLSGANIPDGSVPPVNVDIPHVTQSGGTLVTTLGNWDGEPTAYSYQWRFDGINVASGGSTCPVTAGDVGKIATVIVTATNAAGSTAAPSSVGLAIVAP